MKEYDAFQKKLGKQTREIYKHIKSFESLTREIEELQKQARNNPEACQKLEAIQNLENDPEFIAKINKLELFVAKLEREHEKIQHAEYPELSSNNMRGEKKIKGKGSVLFLKQR
ncbi:hypothetical protein D5952_14045 [Salmonella enterica subsp. enterica]|nr:hypothetical protein [Salmonella enterica subsp. enterica serovar Bonn]EBZ5939301.1 hypothetical protein [Salmonella enterica subsp. enterica serovar Muenchen]MLZ41045.1 hypothetical protein [Salmonella enterica subsp. enterica serovar Bonn]